MPEYAYRDLRVYFLLAIRVAERWPEQWLFRQDGRNAVPRAGPGSYSITTANRQLASSYGHENYGKREKRRTVLPHVLLRVIALFAFQRERQSAWDESVRNIPQQSRHLASTSAPWPRRYLLSVRSSFADRGSQEASSR